MAPERVNTLLVDQILRQGVLGAVVGATLGAPFRGQTTFRRLGFYEPIPARMAPSESLDAWIVAAKHVGAQRPADLLFYSLRNHWHSTQNEAAFGRLNLELGYAPPLCGGFRNPLAQGSGALGRAAVYGLLFHGDPLRAMRHAVADAGIDHAAEGVSAAAAVARMCAMAMPGQSPLSILRAGLEVLPEGSLARRAVTSVVQAIGTGQTPAEVAQVLAQVTGGSDPLHAGRSFGSLALALLAGQSRLGPTVCLGAGCGGASSIVALVAGTLAGLAFPAGLDEWMSPLGTVYVGSSVLRGIDLPETLEEFASLIVDESSASVGLSAAPAPSAPLRGPDAAPALSDLPVPENPATVTTDPEPSHNDVTPSEPVVAVPSGPSNAELAQRLREWMEAGAEVSAISVGPIQVSLRYVDGPSRRSGKPSAVVVGFATDSATPVIVDPTLTPPDGWTLATRLTSCRVTADQPVEFPAVFQSTDPECGFTFDVRLPEGEVTGRVLPSQPWMVCGPFVNHEGRGFDQTFRCEDLLTRSEVFNGRSDLPVKWTPESFPGILFDLEPYFKSGPGALYLYARVTWPAGPRRVVAATSPGTIVRINRHVAVRYHDTHTPAPRAILPYVADFTATGEDEILVKVLRNRDPIEPLVLYFLDAEGRLVEPEGWIPMP